MQECNCSTNRCKRSIHIGFPTITYYLFFWFLGNTIVNVKTAKGRTVSSTRWLNRQLNDKFIKLAKKEGYKSRSAYKLIEINEKFKLLKRNTTVLDLGAYPGGWTQVALKFIMPNECDHAVVAVDLKPMDSIPNVLFIQCDIENDIETLEKTLENKKFDIVLSDMAPKSCGYKQVDHANIINLSEMARDIALRYLKPKGSFVVKILQGEYEGEFRASLKKHFEVVDYFKPKSSRSESSEIYLIALRLLI